tara:strand:+ start:1081 stop:1254 length:174 start_codon:yes stop_codon:yes gene_type:complete
MNITSAQYWKNKEDEIVSINIIIDGKHYAVPMDEDNRHYAEILKQVKEGTLTIKDAE